MTTDQDHADVLQALAELAGHVQVRLLNAEELLQQAQRAKAAHAARITEADVLALRNQLAALQLCRLMLEREAAASRFTEASER